MTYEQTIIAALQQLLPDAPQTEVIRLTQVLVDALSEKLPRVSDPRLIDILSSLQGARLQVPQGEITIGNIEGQGIAIGHHATAQTARGRNIVQVSGGSIAIVINLSPPRISPPPPFMAPTPPPDFVPRSQEFNQLLTYLIDVKYNLPVALTASITGAGGFGKTTLAQALCQDQRVRDAFPDGILWVELGEHPDSLVGKLNGLAYKITGENPNLADIFIASAHLAEHLENKTILLVIDDVWDITHLKPFLQGGSHCVRLITTRNRSILSHDTRQVDVDAMRQTEAVMLLSVGLTGISQFLALQLLASRLGEWPLLLRLANSFLRKRIQSGEDISTALGNLNERLDRRGLTVFDARNPVERNQAVAATLSASLDLLEIDEQLRFAELAIFPEDVEIPLTTLARLWGATANYDDLDTEALCERLRDLSLLSGYSLSARIIRLHDVVRQYLQQAYVSQLIGWHIVLLDAHRPHSGNWADLSGSDPYLWIHLAEHLVTIQADEELFSLTRNRMFSYRQGMIYTADPTLPLRTIQVAIHRAIDKDNAPVVAEFLLLHIKSVIEITQEIPLESLRKKNLERARQIADLKSSEYQVFWYIILSCELKYIGRPEEAAALLELLTKKQLPIISSLRRGLAVDLLSIVFGINVNAGLEIQRQFLDDIARRELVSRLISNLDEEGIDSAAIIAISQSLIKCITDSVEHRKALQLVESGRAMLLAQKTAKEFAHRRVKALESAIASLTAAEQKIETLEVIKQIQKDERLLKDGKGFKDFNEWDIIKMTIAAGKYLQSSGGYKYDSQIQFVIDKLKAGEWKAAYDMLSDLLRSAKHMEALVSQPKAKSVAFSGRIEISQRSVPNLDKLATALQRDELLSAFASDREESLQKVAEIKSRKQIRAQESSFPDIPKNTPTAADYEIKTIIASAQEQIHAGEHERARVVLVSALERSIRTLPASKRSEALVSIAQLQAQIQDFDAARHTIEQIVDPRQRIEALVTTARELVVLGEYNSVHTILVDVRNIAIRILAANSRVDALIAIAQLETQIGRQEDARVTVQLALENTQYIGYQWQRMQALQTIIGLQTVLEDSESAIKTAQRIENARDRAVILCNMASIQARNGCGSETLRTVEHILADREIHLPIIAEALLSAGDMLHFKQLIIPCAYHLKSAYKMCTLLANAYPQEASAIYEVMVSERS